MTFACQNNYINTSIWLGEEERVTSTNVQGGMVHTRCKPIDVQPHKNLNLAGFKAKESQSLK